MQHKNLKYYYCRENCVFFDTCKANIGQCIIFKMEQLLSDLVLKEFELEIFRLNFGLADGIHYSISEIAKKYNISEFKVKRSIGSVLRRLKHPSRRQKYLSLIEIIMSTDEITPYSLLIKSIYQYRGTNAEFWEEFKEEIEEKLEESLSLEQSNVFYNINEFNIIHKWSYKNETGIRVIKSKNLEDAEREYKKLVMDIKSQVQVLEMEIFHDSRISFFAGSSENFQDEYIDIRIKKAITTENVEHLEDDL